MNHPDRQREAYETIAERTDAFNQTLKGRLARPGVEALQEYVQERFGAAFLLDLLRRVRELSRGNLDRGELHQLVLAKIEEEKGTSADFSEEPHEYGHKALAQLAGVDLPKIHDTEIREALNGKEENFVLFLGMLQFLEYAIPSEFKALLDSMQNKLGEATEDHLAVKHLRSHTEKDIGHHDRIAAAIFALRNTEDWDDPEHQAFMNGIALADDFRHRALGTLK